MSSLQTSKAVGPDNIPSTTDALLYMLQAIYEAVDGGEALALIFFADFSKGFDLIDHSILMQELADLEVLLSWITSFVTTGSKQLESKYLVCLADTKRRSTPRN